MNMSHPIRCRCGALRGEVHHPERGTRAVCYCRDCQAYARFLGPPSGMMDAQGGTDIVVVRPQHVFLTAGLANLGCMSLSDKGTLRWYATCCQTPIGNTPRDHKVAHVGLVHDCLEAGDVSLDAAFGPVRMRVNTHGAHGDVPANSPWAFGIAVSRYLASVAWARLSGAYRFNPFFDTSLHQPIVHPRVLTPAERAALEARR